MPFMNFANLDRDKGGLLVRDMNSRLRTTLLKFLSVLRTKKLYSCMRRDERQSPARKIC